MGVLQFVNKCVNEFMVKHGIVHRISCPYTPQKNGRAEPKHRHISETSISMLFHAFAPASLWFDAFATAVYVINRLPSSVLDNKSPYELLFHYAPNYVIFKPFGCRVFSFLRDYAANKLSPRSHPCIFLGYSSAHKGFWCFDLVFAKVLTTRYAQFYEQVFPFSSQADSLLKDLSVSIFLDHSSPSEALAPVVHSPSSHAHSSLCRLCTDSDSTAQNMLHAPVLHAQPVAASDVAPGLALPAPHVADPPAPPTSLMPASC